jgi:predicted amino acid racemase
MEVYGVTKATCGDPSVARSMLDGGVKGIAESRIENIRRLRENGVRAPMMLLRTPMQSQVKQVVELADISLNSEPKILKELSDAALEAGVKHKVIIMVEMGDLREGEIMEETPDLLRETSDMEGLELHGIGMNLACFAGVIPTRKKINEFENFVAKQEKSLGMEFKMVTGGNSGNIPMLMDDPSEGRIGHLRIGEGILLGLETAYRKRIPGTHQDAFVLEAESIETKRKPSVPYGTITQNAFGEIPEFKNLGEIQRLVLALGRQDTILEDLTPIDPDLSLIGGSSDHMVIHDMKNTYRVGHIVKFIPSYGALVSLFTSPYVRKSYTNA